MKRRFFLQTSVILGLGPKVLAKVERSRIEEAADVLRVACSSGDISAAAMYVSQNNSRYSFAFGTTQDENAMFLLGSISKPIAMTALMTLYDRGEFTLEDKVRKYLPEFTSDGRDEVTIGQLMTHVSGLPDQLAENDLLRRGHASLAEFADYAIRTPLSFKPGSNYQYSSMGILLAARIGEVISGKSILDLVHQSVLEPLKMDRSAQGLGRYSIDDMVPMQTDKAAPESGGGDPNAKDWDWNSPYWRKLGAPWGGTHASAPNLGNFLDEFLHERGSVVKPETARSMKSNHNPEGIVSRGLGFNVGIAAGSPGCSDKTFGHTGSTGTIAWADPATNTICVVLTSLPARAAHIHPRNVAAEQISQSVL